MDDPRGGNRPPGGEETHISRIAQERGWVTVTDVESGAELTSLLSTDRIDEAIQLREMAGRFLDDGLFGEEDLLPSAPERFGRYRIVRRLGSGGCGQVYLALDPRIGREIALKVLDRGSLEISERFDREMNILSRIDHPGIVKIFDAGEEEGRPFYTMEYLGDRHLGDAEFDRREAVEIVAAIAEACHAAHEEGIIHRDLKPSNVLLEPRPIVADFGCARIESSRMTRSGQVLGTVPYMSPEQLRGEEIDRRTDVYSIGAILYEILTGRLPFPGESIPAISTAVAAGHPDPPRSLDPSIPLDLEAITLTALAHDPDRRYRSALDLASDLRRWLEGGPVSARPTPWPVRLARSVRRHRGRTATALLVTTLASVAIGLALRPPESPPPPPGPEAAPGSETALRLTGLQLGLAEWEGLLSKEGEIDFTAMRDLESRLGEILAEPGLSARHRSEALHLRARARIHLGNSDEAIADLDLGLETGEGPIGEMEFERARLLWERMLRAWFRRDHPEVRALRNEVREGMHRAIVAGFARPEMNELARPIAVLVGPVDVAERLAAWIELDRIAARHGRLDEVTYKLLGDLHLASEETEAALEMYAEAIRIRPQYPQAYEGRALARGILARDLATRSPGARTELGRAVEALERSLRLRPEGEAALFLLDQLFVKSFRGPPAQIGREGGRFYETAGESIVEVLAAAHERRGEADGIVTTHARMRFLLGLHRARSGAPGELDETIRFLRRQSDRTPGDPHLAILLGATIVLAALLEGTDRFDEARAVLQRAHSRAPENGEILRWIGWNRELAGNPEGARRAWKEAVELLEDPTTRRDLQERIEQR